MMSEDVVLLEKDDRGIATVTLNRPDVFNGYNEALLTSLRDSVETLNTDADVRAVLLRGAGKHFSAGADVNWFKELSTAPMEVKLAAARLSTGAMRALDDCRKPVISLVQNACFGGGAGYVSASDVVIASEDARFAITEVRLGITPAPILNQVIKAIGVRQARRYAVTAETFDVERAKEIGLVHEICPVGGLDAAVEPVIDAILRSGPVAVSRTKELIGTVSDTILSDEMAEQLATISAAGRDTEEGVEGFSAFLEKRSPNWYPGES